MSARVSTNYPEDARVVEAGLDGAGLHLIALCLATRDTKDGWVPIDRLRERGGTTELIFRLVALGLLHVDGCGRVKPDGWRRLRRAAIPAAVRQFVLDRDGHRCVYCGATERLSLDHVMPFSRGGSDHPANLQALCLPCNWSKGAKI